MITTKLPAHSTFRESVRFAIGPLALILCAALGSKIGRVTFGASEDAWTNAYIFGMVLGFVFFAIVNRKPTVEKTLSRQYPLWVFLCTIISSFLLCELFKVI
jgi:hypothetical protein